MRGRESVLGRHGRYALLILLASAACSVTQPTARVTSGGGPSVAQAQAVPYDGPKARIAVSSFVDKTAKGFHQIGDGLSDMLTTELFNTNRFIVLERQMLGEVLAEQDLAAAGIPKKDEMDRVVDVHALRKSFVTHLRMQGVEVEDAQRLARHSDVKLTQDIYTDYEKLVGRETRAAEKLMGLWKFGQAQDQDS